MKVLALGANVTKVADAGKFIKTSGWKLRVNLGDTVIHTWAGYNQ